MSSGRSPRARSTSSTSITSLPSRWVANRCSSSRSRGGGTSSISALAASMRNFGFDGPGRRAAAQPGQLLADQVLPAYLGGGGLPLPLGLGEHERRVAALVGVDHAVVDLPRRLADRVEEPAVVGDHDQRARAGRRRWSASQATASTSRWLVGSSSTTRSWSPSSSAASEQRRRSPPDSPSDGAVEGDAGQQHLDDLAGARVGGPLVVGAAAEHRLADACGCRRGRRPGGGSRSAARAPARPGRSRAPPGRSSPRAAWSCRRRCGRRCRSARPAAMPSETSVEQRRGRRTPWRPARG